MSYSINANTSVATCNVTDWSNNSNVLLSYGLPFASYNIGVNTSNNMLTTNANGVIITIPYQNVAIVQNSVSNTWQFELSYVANGAASANIPLPYRQVFIYNVYYTFPSYRVTKWQPGVSYSPVTGPYAPSAPPPGWNGGIPVRSTVYTTLTPSGGDDTNAINNACANCPAHQSVVLSAGTFTISGGGIQITNSYITLRGAGPGPGQLGTSLNTLPSNAGATLLVKSDANTNPAPVITIGTITGVDTMFQTAAFANDAVFGANSVTLTANPPAGLAVGEIVYVNETYDSTYTWYDTNYGDQGIDNGGYNGWGEGQTGTVAASRPIGQAMEVASINGRVISFTTPFHWTFRVSHSAHLGRVNISPRTSWVGVENLFMTGGDGGDGGGNFCFGNCSYSWGKKLESSGHGPKFGGGLCHFFSSFRCELRDSYLHSNFNNIQNISPGGGFYNIVIDSYAADNLIENNISWIANKVMVMRGSGGGNVIGYNYMDDGYGDGYPNQMESGLNADHMTTPHYELFEGNYSWGLSTDSRWGNAIYITWFRNWTTARRISAWLTIPPSATSTAHGNPLLTLTYTDASGTYYYEDEYNRMMAEIGSHHWWYNYVGNVFGEPSLPLLTNPRSHFNVPQTGYDYQWCGNNIPATIDYSRVPIWALGIPDGNEPAFSGNGLDPSVLPTTLRDGNYDWNTKLIYWHGIGGSANSQTIPPGASITPSSILPSSLYLTGKPSFFGAATWPWIDGSNSTTPMPGALPAQTRFNLGTPNAT